MAVSRRTQNKIGRGLSGFAGGFLGGKDITRKKKNDGPYDNLQIGGTVPLVTGNDIFSGEGEMEELARLLFEESQKKQGRR